MPGSQKAPKSKQAGQYLELQAEEGSFEERSSRRPASESEEQRMVEEGMEVHRPLPGPPDDVPDPEDTVFPDEESGDNPTTLAPEATATAPSPSASALQFGVRGVSGGTYPPDTTGVCDKKSFFVMTNQQVWGYARSSKNKYTWMTLGDFFTKGIPNMPSKVVAFDPYIVRDPLSNQFVAVALNDPKAQNKVPGLFLGSTQAGNVLGDWQYVWISCSSLGLPANQWFDYPRVGTSKSFLTITVNVYNTNGDYVDAMALVIDKPTYYTGPVTLALFKGMGFTIVPARTFDNTDPHYLVCTGNANDGQGRCYVQLYSVTGSFSNQSVQIMGPTNIAANQPYNPAGGGAIAPQKGTSSLVSTGDNRMQSAVKRNGSVWCVHTIFMPATGAQANSGIQVYQLNPSTPALTQVARYYDTNKKWFYAYPSVAINSLGDALVGMAAFNSGVFPQGTYTSWAAGDPTGTLRKKGSTESSASYWALGKNRWGDYSATIVDPVDDKHFWTLQETANGQKQWWTSWMQVPKIS